MNFRLSEHQCCLRTDLLNKSTGAEHNTPHQILFDSTASSTRSPYFVNLKIHEKI